MELEIQHFSSLVARHSVQTFKWRDSKINTPTPPGVLLFLFAFSAGRATFLRVSETVLLTELAHHFGGVAMLPVNCFVHCAHVFGTDFSVECVERQLDLRPALQGFFADQRHRLVRR